MSHRGTIRLATSVTGVFDQIIDSMYGPFGLKSYLLTMDHSLYAHDYEKNLNLIRV